MMSNFPVVSLKDLVFVLPFPSMFEFVIITLYLSEAFKRSKIFLENSAPPLLTAEISPPFFTSLNNSLAHGLDN